MRPDSFHTSLYDLAALGTLFSGITLALLVGFANRPNQRANLFLSLALGVIVVKTGGLSAAFLLALGPLLFFYTKHLTRPDWRFQRKDWLSQTHSDRAGTGIPFCLVGHDSMAEGVCL